MVCFTCLSFWLIHAYQRVNPHLFTLFTLHYRLSTSHIFSGNTNLFRWSPQKRNPSGTSLAVLMAIPVILWELLIHYSHRQHITLWFQAQRTQFITNYLLFKAQCLLHVPPVLPSKIKYSAYRAYLCVLHGSQNKQQLFRYTAVTDGFYNRDGLFTMPYELNL